MTGKDQIGVFVLDCFPGGDACSSRIEWEEGVCPELTFQFFVLGLEERGRTRQRAVIQMCIGDALITAFALIDVDEDIPVAVRAGKFPHPLSVHGTDSSARSKQDSIGYRWRCRETLSACTEIELGGDFCRPYGTRYIFSALTQDLRPGLTYVAPTGLRIDRGSACAVRQLGAALGEQGPGFAVAFVAVAGFLCGRGDWA